MAKAFNPAVLTANDLIEGDAVWWTGAAWSRDIARARVATSPEAAEKLALLGATPLMEASAVGPYTVEVEILAGKPTPISRRERIRADRTPTFAYGQAAQALSRAA
jgi:hypothetical protein